jgi:pyruvate/2-oxoglutarate dehydrogenase complex dihydrolipoamide acyltransferase (E2) component
MSDKLAAFAARGDATIAGTVSVGDGETFDVGDALREGDGTIVVVAGSKLEYSLNGYEALRSVEVPAGAEAVNAEEAEDEAGAIPNATEAAIRKAAELDVDLDQVDGTGAGGKITVEDVEKAAQTGEGDGS